MDDDNYNQIHLIKLKIGPKSGNTIKISCPFLQKFSPNIQLRNKNVVYVPLIGKLIVSNNFISNSSKNQIPIDIQPLLQHPFDRHNLKIQTYQDCAQNKKGQVLSLYLQFSLYLTEKKQQNYLKLFLRHANLKKDLKIFGKMSPYITITNEEWKYTTREIKNGHLNPHFEEEVQIPYSSIFDKIFIELKDQDNRIGCEALYIFQFFGRSDQRELQLKKQHQMVGTLKYVVSQFEPQDF